MIKKLSMKHRLSITRWYYSQIIKLSITRWYYSQYTIKLMLWIWDYFAFTTVCQKTAAQAVKLDFRFCFVFFFNLITTATEQLQNANFPDGDPLRRTPQMAVF